MGSGASTHSASSHSINLKLNLSGESLTCSLSSHEVDQFVQSTHFTTEEVIALCIHFDNISSMKREDGLIDRTEFQLALGFPVKESIYVDRMFQLFDKNKDSYISFEEFIISVSILSTKGTREEKIKFCFDILDLNADDRISQDEMHKMLKSSVSENKLVIKDEYIDTIIKKTFEEADLDKDNFISRGEFAALVDKNSSMLDHVTVNVSSIIADHLAAFRENQNESSLLTDAAMEESD